VSDSCKTCGGQGWVYGALEDEPRVLFRVRCHDCRRVACPRCGDRGGDPEHKGPCGECGKEKP
jgi:hypothetical protein